MRLTKAGLLRLVLIACLLPAALSAGWAAAGEFEDALAEGDRHFALRLDGTRARAAVRAYKRAHDLKPDDWEAIRKLVRSLIFVGAQYTGAEELPYYERAEGPALRAVELYPDRAGPHYWYGTLQAASAGACNPIKALMLVDSARKEMARVIELDPAYWFGGAYRVLGRLDTRLPVLAGGDRGRAEKHLTRAVEMGPGYLLNQFYLADLYRTTGRVEDARRLIEDTLELDPAPGFEPEAALWKQAARKILIEMDNNLVTKENSE